MLLAGVITPTIFNVETSVYPTSPTCTADTGAVLPLLLASPIEDAAAVETSITANALNASRPKTIRLIKTPFYLSGRLRVERLNWGGALTRTAMGENGVSRVSNGGQRARQRA